METASLNLLILTLKDKTRRQIISVTKQECTHELDVYVLISKMVTWVSLVAEMVKNLPAMQETRVRSLCREDPLEKGMATNSSILAGKSHRQRSLVSYSPWGQKRVGRY